MNNFKTLLLVLTFFACVTTHAEAASTTDTEANPVAEVVTDTDTKVNEESDATDADTKLPLVPVPKDEVVSDGTETPVEATDSPTKDAEPTEEPADEEESDDEEPDADDC